MKNMTLVNLARACKGQLFGASHSDDIEAAGVVIDSRLVAKDYIFIAAAGERVDGHDFIDQAFEQGALGVVCEKAPAKAKGPYILVDNSFEALKAIAGWYRMQLNIKVVGITGSVGKTSTKEFISRVLSQKYQVLKTEGNYNNEIGMPLTILKIQDYHDIAVLEMGISQFGEMHRLSEIAKPDICVITNIGQCHLENLGSREGILKAKTEIFDFMSEDGRVCINGDDDMLSTIREVKGRLPIKFGMANADETESSNTAAYDVSAHNIKTHGLFGSSCDIHMKDGVFTVNIPLPGNHMIHNALAAASVGSLLGLSYEEIKAGIEAVQPVGGRSNIMRSNKLTIIDDCYNANPVSMKAAIDLLKTADTRKVAVLGDMGELGINEKELHKEIGAYAASSDLDLLICVGTLSLSMYEGANNINNDNTSSQKKMTVLYFESRDKLIEALPSILKDGDTILVKASHFMGFEHVVHSLL